MAIFHYSAKDRNGGSHQGEIESVSAHMAAVTLRRKGLIILSISETSKNEGSFFDRIFNRVGFSDLVVFTRQLAVMVGAGLTVAESIDILEEQQLNKRLKSVLSDVSHDIKGGLSLHQALGKHSDVFPPIYINLVKSGETSGKLDEVLKRLADTLEKEREFRSKIRGAMIYPIVVISMMIIVVIIMMVFVVPKLTGLYKDTSLDLPLPTKILIGMSDFFLNFWWVAVGVIILGVIVFKRWVAQPEGKLAYDRLILRLPIIGKLTTNVTLTNFSRTFGLLISAGIPLLEAINVIEDITDNTIFKNALKSSYSAVERGLAFSAQLLNLPVFPKIVGQMMRVGEETGKVDEVSFRLADYFEQESDQMVKNLTVAIEPIIIVILGLGVAFLVISIILPIYKLTTAF